VSSTFGGSLLLALLKAAFWLARLVVVSRVSGSFRRMSDADLDLASWRRLHNAAAQRLADRIADNTGAELVAVRPHEYAGRPGRIAQYRRDGTLYALVPGGEVVLGYDGAWFTPTPEQAADYAAWPDGLPSDIRAFVDLVTSPPRVVYLPALLVAVEVVEPGARSADPDDPSVRQLLADLQRDWEHYRPPGMISDYGWGRVEVKVDDRCQLISARVVEKVTRDAVVADLAGRGLRLLTPDEGEHACGAGAMTLFRWGDDCPTDCYPTQRRHGPHRLPNAVGLVIGHDPTGQRIPPIQRSTVAVMEAGQPAATTAAFLAG
jgi:hypothetical protein